jgi:hypothetical protein
MGDDIGRSPLFIRLGDLSPYFTLKEHTHLAGHGVELSQVQRKLRAFGTASEKTNKKMGQIIFLLQETHQKL